MRSNQSEAAMRGPGLRTIITLLLGVPGELTVETPA
jgi:hypothetical protein